MSGVDVVWDGEGTAEIVGLAGDKIELVSTRPFPPGSRPKGMVGAMAATAMALWIKVHGSRREADGRFRVVGRLLNASRELRADLERLATRTR